MEKQTLQQLIQERQRLAAESERIMKRLATLSAEIAAHLPEGGQQQQQQQPQGPKQPPPPASPDSKAR